MSHADRGVGNTRRIWRRKRSKAQTAGACGGRLTSARIWSKAGGPSSPAVVGVQASPAGRPFRALKRLFDIVVAATLLVVLLPMIITISVAIFLDSRGPILYRCDRVGYHGVQLQLLKFRKMRVGVVGAPLTSTDDDRFTRLGGFLARTRMDEIPQLWHVLRGEMSLVGPRPEDPRFVALYPDRFKLILSVRPGITGWTQLVYAQEHRQLAGADPVAAYVRDLLPHKVQLDCLYASGCRLRQDLRILLWTPLMVSPRFVVDYHSSRQEFMLMRAIQHVNPSTEQLRQSIPNTQRPTPVTREAQDS